LKNRYFDKTHLELASALALLSRNGILIAHRIITDGDEYALLPGEIAFPAAASLGLRRQTGTGRIVARELLLSAGIRDPILPRTTSGSVRWPRGYIGSIAHDASVAVCAIASTRQVCALGVDIEPAEFLPTGLADLIATPSERRKYSVEIVNSRLLFVCKEAAYKAIHPLTGAQPEFQDVEVDLYAGMATMPGGVAMKLLTCTTPRVVAIVFLEAPA
jgi:4'-phosphopantetheinyl transferase EntD